MTIQVMRMESHCSKKLMLESDSLTRIGEKLCKLSLRLNGLETIML